MTQFNLRPLENKNFLGANLKNILDYIKKTIETPVIGQDIELGKHILESIFHDVSILDEFNKPSINKDAQDIIDFYYDQETVIFRDYVFTNQIPIDGDYPQFNDHIFTDDNGGFDLNSINEFEISIIPIETNFWRFGFRLSKSMDFPTIKTSRHVVNYPFIHLSKGNLDANDNVYDYKDDISQPYLELAIYSGDEMIDNPKAILNYHNDKVTIKFIRRISGRFLFR